MASILSLTQIILRSKVDSYNMCSTYCTIVSLYIGRGAITQNTVTLSSSSFTATPPNFTLYGDTGGGPPVEYIWTRNGVVITNNDSYHIYFELNTDATRFTRERLSNAFCRSPLIVTGVLPGVYRYSVNNKATPTSVRRDINIEGIFSINYICEILSG